MSTARKTRQSTLDAASGLILPLDQIVPFDRDPRQSLNTEYARIKASIHAQGVDQPLVVTRRPGADHYLIAAGGNTRLKILRELLEETGDRKFAQAVCVFKPWRGEAEVVLAHLRENDLRGALTFLDKARAVREARLLIEKEDRRLDLTQSELVQILRDRGYALSQTSLSYMEYAIDVLETRLPLALLGGLAHKEVVGIRALESAARALWNDRVAPGEDSFDDIFTQLCRRYDGPDWDFLSLRQALEAEIAERLNQTVHAVRLALDARLHGVVEVALPKRDDDDDGWPEPVVPKPRLTSERDSQPAVTPTSDDGASGSAAMVRISGADAPDPGQNTFDGKYLHEVTPASTTGTRPDAADLSRLRQEAAQFAAEIASRHGLSDLIVPLSDEGTGFLVVDVPKPALLGELDESALAQTSMIWWQLMACAEMTVAPIDYLLPHLSPTSVLYRALKEQDAGLLFGAVWTLDPGQLGFRLWRTLSEQDWSDLLSLMTCYRNLHRMSAASHIELWSTSS